jgi:lipoprotein signal peptidase
VTAAPAAARVRQEPTLGGVPDHRDDAGPAPGDTGRPTRWHRSAWLLLLTVFLLAVLTDQATKWLTWRYFDGTVINDGGYILLGSARSWFAEPVPGALANAVGGALIVLGLAVLVRRPRRPVVTVGGGLLAAGWTSNVLDRVGLHDWTAPGSARGVVDFIPSGGGSRCNLADLWIAVGLFLLGLEIRRHGRRRAVGTRTN